MMAASGHSRNSNEGPGTSTMSVTSRHRSSWNRSGLSHIAESTTQCITSRVALRECSQCTSRNPSNFLGATIPNSVVRGSNQKIITTAEGQQRQTGSVIDKILREMVPPNLTDEEEIRDYLRKEAERRKLTDSTQHKVLKILEESRERRRASEGMSGSDDGRFRELSSSPAGSSSGSASSVVGRRRARRRWVVVAVPPRPGDDAESVEGYAVQNNDKDISFLRQYLEVSSRNPENRALGRIPVPIIIQRVREQTAQNEHSFTPCAPVHSQSSYQRMMFEMTDSVLGELRRSENVDHGSHGDL